MQGNKKLTRRHVQLSKEDEEALGEEVEVRREDQDKINKFSRLHQREIVLEKELKAKQVGSDFGYLRRCPLTNSGLAEGEGRTGRRHSGVRAG